jgi:predicted MFS family arabinose efflux permease
MLELELFSHRNFAVGNLETLCMYAGLAIFFYLTIYLQQVAGYSALDSGTATLPVTLVMFTLSRRFGALADRLGPRLFMGAGPLVAATGILLLARLDRQVAYLADLLPALLLFALGLSLTVAPLTATVLADADESDVGIASAINSAVARVAGLLGISVVDPGLPCARRGGRCRGRDRDRQPDAHGRGGEVRRRPARRSAAPAVVRPG